MKRLYDITTWFLGMVGLALLILSLFAVPTSISLGAATGAANRASQPLLPPPVCIPSACDDIRCFTVVDCPPNGTGGECDNTAPACEDCVCRNIGFGCRCYGP
jgi:hypothetical protein